MKIWQIDDERLLPECVQQMNTGNVGKVGIWSGTFGDEITSTQIFDDSMNGIQYCDVLQSEFKKSFVSLPKKMSYISTESCSMPHIQIGK